MEKVENKVVNKVENKDERVINGGLKAKSLIVGQDLVNDKGFIPTIAWFTRDQKGRYSLSFNLDEYEVKDEYGKPLKKIIKNEPEFINQSDMDLLITLLNVPSSKLAKFGRQAYLRLIRCKGVSTNNATGNEREYDFMRYELFINTSTEMNNNDSIWYHRNIRFGKAVSLSWAITKNFLLNSKKPYFLIDNTFESNEDGDLL